MVNLEVEGGEVPAVASGTNLKKIKGAAKAQQMSKLPIHVQKPNGSETVVAQTKTEAM